MTRRQLAASLSALLLVLQCLPLCWSGCATPAARTGGPRDTIAPRLDTLASSPLFALDFSGNSIRLSFDEWIKLDNPAKEILISPPLQQRPTVKLRGRSILLSWEEALRPNTTYIVNFGKAIKDLTEGNAPDNFQYVFSTGSFIDSLRVRGELRQSSDGQPAKAITLMLYDQLADSVVYREKPYYFAFSDEQGRFELGYIKPGTYKVFALKDANGNYLYDLAEEEIAFLAQPLVLADSTGIPDLRLRLFQESPSALRLLSKERRDYGRAKLVFSGPPDSVRVRAEPPAGAPLFLERQNDTLLVWYGQYADGFKDWALLIEAGGPQPDTLRFDVPARADFLKNTSTLLPSSPPNPRAPGTIRPGEGIVLRWQHPLASADTASILLLEDTLRRPLPFRLGLDGRSLRADYAFKPNSLYTLELPAGALADIFGLRNDSLSYSFRGGDPAKYGNILLEAALPDSTQHYVIELLGNGDASVATRRSLGGSAPFRSRFETLPPGTYKLRIIRDDNGNGRWDTGDYLRGRQPEAQSLRQLEPLRENWDLDVRIEGELFGD